MTSKWTEGSTAKKPYVITIEASEQSKNIKIRAAAYIRVSTSSEDQHNSFEAQMRYYTSFISSRNNWALVDVYADEGITGTAAEKREDFQRLLSDCRRGLIDKILVKSISRFARNTKECLETIRELKALEIGIQFEKENIDTSKVSGEMLTALFASFAQAESESISGNMRWSYQRRMQAGTFNTCRAPYGYRLEHGKLFIQEDEAEIIRYIFEEYLKGSQIRAIASYLAKNEEGNRQWNRKTVEYILQNERYAGNALLQKRYTTDTFPHKMKYNKGERTLYYISGSNPPIISQEMFEQVQKLRQSRTEGYMSKSNPRSLSKVMYCGNCGGMLRPKPIREKIYMVCRLHEQDKSACPLPPIPEKEVHQAFFRLYYKLKHHSEILVQLIDGLSSIRQRKLLWSEDVVELNKKISELSSQNQMLASIKQQGLIDPDVFIFQSNQLTEQIRAAKLKKDALLKKGSDSIMEKTQDMLDALEAGPNWLDEFDRELFHELVEKIIAESRDILKFHLNNGLILTEKIERNVR